MSAFIVRTLNTVFLPFMGQDLLNIFVDLGGISVTRLNKGGVNCVKECFILDYY